MCYWKPISLHCLEDFHEFSLFACPLKILFKISYLSFSPLPFASLLFTAICKASSDNHFDFLHFFFLGWSWSLPPVQCLKPPFIVLQVLRLSDLIPSICFSLPLYNHKGFDQIDRVPDELWTEVRDSVRKAGIKTIPKKEMQKSKMADWGGLTNSCEKKRS